MQHFNVWQNAWKDGYEDPLDLTLPDDWSLEIHELGGDHFPPLTKDQMREKINNPIGSKTIREMAASGHQAVIVFDDLSRGTKCKGVRHDPKEYSVRHETDKAIEFLRNRDGQRKKDAPFFLTLAYNPPHSPYECLDDCMEEDYNLYKNMTYSDLYVRVFRSGC